MNEIIQKIADPTNLYWAWEKTKQCYKAGDTWFDEVEVIAFEANLEEELRKLNERFLTGQYYLSPLRPVAFPKSKDPEKGPRNRQIFWVSVIDQVAWLAVINVIGAALDYRMPFWSYGNRLFISTFFTPNPETGKEELKFGWYRNTARHTYRKWTQSWPLYRRHVAITCRIMGHQKAFQTDPEKFKQEELEDEIDKAILDQNENLPQHLRVKYIDKDYWNVQLSGKVFWAGIDLEKFYPSIKLDVILKNLRLYFPKEKNSEDLEKLLSSMLVFSLNLQGWDEESLKLINLGLSDKNFSGLPTGLFASGFLANLAMLEVDEEVSKKMASDKKVAHFRFVDDHVILADDYDSLINWIIWYKKLLKDLGTGSNINLQKTEPPLFGQYLEAREEKGLDDEKTKELFKKAKEEVSLDPDFPTPLMTQTLTKVSQIAQTEFDLLDIAEEDQLIADIEHLLLADFPDQELRRDTRISFAATMLSKLVPRKQFDFSQLALIDEQIYKIQDLINEDKDSSDKSQLDAYKVEVDDLYKERNRIQKEEIEIAEDKIRTHTSKLLLKAIKSNHDKRRLWRRYFEFSLRMGNSDLKQIIQLLDNLKEDQVANELSREYIYSSILQILADQLFSVYFILSNQNTPQIQIRRTKLFLKGVTEEDFLKLVILKNDFKKFYSERSLDTFKVALGSVLYLLVEEGVISEDATRKHFHKIINKFGLMNWFANSDDFITVNKSIGLGELTWWLVKKTFRSDLNEPNLIWREAIKYLGLEGNVNQSLVVLYPKEISLDKLKIFETMNGSAKKYLDIDGWIYDILNHHRNVGEVVNPNNFGTKISRVAKIMEKDNGNRITLSQWIEWSARRDGMLQEKEDFIFDPRLSEWTSLELVRQIAEILYENVHTLTIQSLEQLKSYDVNVFLKIHPSNYLLPKEWINLEGQLPLTWERWKVLVKDKVILQSKEYLISDSRYSYRTDDIDHSDREVTIVNGLSVLLLVLLVKDMDFPPYWNPLGMQNVYLNLVQSKLRQMAISSKTNSIIQSCFSKRNKETPRVREDQKELDLADDTILDPPEIRSISNLIKHIKDAQLILEKYQLTVQDHQPRELIPINLIQLTRSNLYLSETYEEDNQ